MQMQHNHGADKAESRQQGLATGRGGRGALGALLVASLGAEVSASAWCEVPAPSVEPACSLWVSLGGPCTGSAPDSAPAFIFLLHHSAAWVLGSSGEHWCC